MNNYNTDNLVREHGEIADILHKKYHVGTPNQETSIYLLNLAAQLQKNLILARANQVSIDDGHPSALEAIAITLGYERDFMTSISQALLGISENVGNTFTNTTDTDHLLKRFEVVNRELLDLRNEVNKLKEERKNE